MEVKKGKSKRLEMKRRGKSEQKITEKR